MDASVNNPPIARFSRQVKQREDDDLRQQRHAEADHDVRDRLDQRHPPRLLFYAHIAQVPRLVNRRNWLP